MKGNQNTAILQEPVPGPYDRLPEIGLSPDTVLQLAPNFRTRLDAAGHVIVDSPAGTIVDIGPRGFAILSMFSRPVTLGDALDRRRLAGWDAAWAAVGPQWTKRLG